MTISDISLLFSISNYEIKNIVAKQIMNFQVDIGNSNRIKLVAKFLHSITIIRNFCAHGSRLYNRIFHQKAKLLKIEKNVLKIKADGTKDNERLFGFIFIIKKLLNNENFINFKQELVNLKTKIPSVNMGFYGFPDNWENLV